MSITTIYGLCDPRDGSVRYVGKADNVRRRYKAHLNERPGNHRTNWIETLRRLGLKPALIEIQKVSRDDWEEWERYWIAMYREVGCELLNGTDGGDCGPALKPGTVKRSAETRAKMGAWQKGRVLPEETRNKISAAHQGKKAPAGFAEKIRALMTGRKIHSDEFKQSLAERNRQRIYTTEMRERLRQAQANMADDKKERIRQAVAASNRRRANKGKTP